MIDPILSLRMERQGLISPVGEVEYGPLYRDLQPGQSEYWHGFGMPPVLTFRAAFDDIAYNRIRQLDRTLIKGRFASGNVGWIERQDLELFAGLYRKPLTALLPTEERVLALIESAGPMTIQQIKEETGLLVREITPILHRLQQAFLVYEDQYDGAWDRGWYAFSEMFPEADIARFTRLDALRLVLPRFALRLVWFDAAMARSFFKLPVRELGAALSELAENGVLTPHAGGFVLTEDLSILACPVTRTVPRVLALHRNDFLVRSHEHLLKKLSRDLTDGLSYDSDTLQYLLIDGQFHGLAAGHFRYGPYEINDIRLNIPAPPELRDQVISAVMAVNPGAVPRRFMGETIQ